MSHSMHELHSQKKRYLFHQELRTREIRVFRSQTPTFNWPKQEFCTPYIFYIIKEEYLSVYISFPSVVLVIYNLPSIALLGILYFIFRLYGCVHSPLRFSLSHFPFTHSTHPLSMLLLPHRVRCVWQWNRKKSYTAEKNTERFLFFVFEQGLKLSSCSFSSFSLSLISLPLTIHMVRLDSLPFSSPSSSSYEKERCSQLVSSSQSSFFFHGGWLILEWVVTNPQFFFLSL